MRLDSVSTHAGVPAQPSGPTMRAPATITTTDLLKLAGLAFVFADHIGLFFVPDDDWWRVFGRAAAPIFFFLIGFARSGAVPLIWLVFGAILTALDVFVSDGLEDVTLNILFNFALIRFAMPVIEKHVLARSWGMPALAFFCAAMIPPAALVLEYGAEGWLWALVGLAAREAISRADARLQRNLIALVCVALYVIVESRDFEFEPAQTAVFAILMAALSITLLAFRRTDACAAPAPLARVFNWIGRRSLEIYAVSLFVMQLTGYLLETGAGSEDADEA
jgi:hypothetical protein